MSGSNQGKGCAHGCDNFYWIKDKDKKKKMADGISRGVRVIFLLFNFRFFFSITI